MKNLLVSAAALVMMTAFATEVAFAQDATPEPVSSPTGTAGPMSFVLIERAASVTNLDLGEPGGSIGDMIIWGPNALYDEANTADSGATTQGFCVLLQADGMCELTETILFPDGSSIELQGVQAEGSGVSRRTIVGGSGQWRGATGNVTVEPTGDLTLWTKRFEIWL